MERPWVSNYQAGVAATIEAHSFDSLNDYFLYYTRQYSELTAFSNEGVELTYHELRRFSLAFAAYCQKELGLRKGDRVGLMMPNLLQYPVCFYGLLLAGCIVVNINPLYTPRELKHQLDDAGVKVIVICTSFAKSLKTVLPEVALDHVISTSIGDMLGMVKGSIISWLLKTVKKQPTYAEIEHTLSFSSILEQGFELSLDPVTVTRDDLALLQYTGGTTGVAKSAMLSHINLLSNALQLRQWVRPGVDISDTMMSPLPLYHIFSLLVCCISSLSLGINSLLVINPRNLAKVIKYFSKNEVHCVVGINTLYNALLNYPGFTKLDFSNLKLCTSGGMPTQHGVAEQWQKVTGKPILQGYGLTETSPIISLNPMDEPRFNGSSGLIFPETDVCIVDENEQCVALGEPGEIWVKGPQVMSGYWHLEEETAGAFSEDGWFKTGDLGSLNEQGYLTILDRKKDMILVSGFNVYPNEVEQILSDNPLVKDVVVIGIPCDVSGEAVKAIIVKQSEELEESALRQYCKQHLTGYKVPKYFEFRDSLPMSPIGKVLRRSL